MYRKAQFFCGLSGILSILMMMVGMGPFAQLMPPPSAMITAAEVAAHVKQNHDGIIWGMIFVNMGVAFSVALVVGISIEMWRIEAPNLPVLSLLQLTTGTVASMFLMLPAMIMTAAAFRPDYSPDILLMMHDLSTFCTFIPFSVATLEAIVIGIATFMDKSPVPVFPRWMGVYSIVAAISYIPMGFIGLYKTGSWASDGWWGWTLPTALVVPWYLLLGVFLMLRGGRTTA